MSRGKWWKKYKYDEAFEYERLISNINPSITSRKQIAKKGAKKLAGHIKNIHLAAREVNIPKLAWHYVEALKLGLICWDFDVCEKIEHELNLEIEECFKGEGSWKKKRNILAR